MTVSESQRVSIVTGAGGGIGAGITKAFLDLGHRVVAIDVAEQPLRALAESLDGANRLSVLALDLSDADSWGKALRFTIDSAGPPDILVNNAARIIRQSIHETTVDDWENQVSVNLKATYFLSKLFAEDMRKRNWGRIINLSSQAAHTGGAADCSIYATTKGGVETMTRSFARAYAQSGVTVNAIAPGVVMTSMIEQTLSPQTIRTVVNNIPIGRVAEVEEIAAAAVYLCGDQAGSVTGHVLDVTGGMTIR